MDNNYENLANAIILQAAKDYRKALRTLSLNPHNRSAQYEHTMVITRDEPIVLTVH